MELRILYLDIHFNEEKEIILKNGNTEISQEQLFDNYDFIRIKFDSSHRRIINIFDKQNYCVYKTFAFGKGDTYFINNNLKKYIILDSDLKNEFINYENFSHVFINSNYRNKIRMQNNDAYYNFQDKLPCFVVTGDTIFLDDYYKITKMEIPYLYYLEQKGQLTKRAIKK
ncbi:hypothetical protein Hokovirus_2_29 [Hokovirus HKV1]|uniref:Uncharacterized protein n=1 Tax=Hokovirus HKV1 TaxID=1977638 RepID=A0A1V0SFL0_9VIRU|nr:hypothetical protein Hokovirus_2_29 [Hokovirus HKV1]